MKLDKKWNQKEKQIVQKFIPAMNQALGALSSNPSPIFLYDTCIYVIMSYYVLYITPMI